MSEFPFLDTDDADYQDFKILNYEGHPELNERTHLTGQAKKQEVKK